MEEASKRVRNNKDPQIDEIIHEIAEKEGIPVDKVRSAVNHFFDWQWVAFHEASYVEYHWPKFGKFTWFNRGDDDPRYKEGLDEYLDGKKIKDRNKSIREEEIRLSKEKEDVIKEIQLYDAKYLKDIPEKDKWKKYGWSIGGENPESGWNEATLGLESIDKLKQLNKLLEKYGSKGQTT